MRMVKSWLRGKGRPWLASMGLMIVPMGVLLVGGHDLSAAEHGASSPPRMPRTLEPVVVRGSDLVNTRGRPVANLALMAMVGGALKPVPFQVDELDRDGQRCLLSGPNGPNKHDVTLLKDSPPDVLDDNDELVFMAGDSGDQAGQGALPADAVAMDEVALTDGGSGKTAWLYLVAFESAAPRNPTRYLQYVPTNGSEGDKVIGSAYRLHFYRDDPITAWFLGMGGDDDNILDNMKVRFHSQVLGILSIDRTNEDLGSRLWGYTDGPVRVIRQIRSSIRLVSRLKSPSITSDMMLYRQSFQMPVRISLPFTPAGLVSNVHFTGTVDCRDRKGWKVRLSSDERWLNVDGRMDETELSVKRENARWFIIRGPGKAMISQFSMRAAVQLPASFHYNDDASGSYAPEAKRGEVPAVGFHVKDGEKLPRGAVHFFVSAFGVLGNSSEDDLVRTAKMLEQPLKVRVSSVYLREATVQR